MSNQERSALWGLFVAIAPLTGKFDPNHPAVVVHADYLVQAGYATPAIGDNWWSITPEGTEAIRVDWKRDWMQKLSVGVCDSFTEGLIRS